MKRLLFTFLTFYIFLVNITGQDIKSPQEFLGYETGSQFTFHHKADEYFRYVAEKSPVAEYREYGTTYEGRPLGVCIVSDEANLKNIEELRKNNLVKTGLLDGDFTGRQIPIIWLAYNVHGNESAGMETAMKVLWTLVSGTYPGSSDWLKSCIIIIDPCQNPDGRDLYAGRYRNTMSLIPNADGSAREHNQAFPSARLNHYLFDLNRDWTWQTQKETASRIALYNQFMPHVHADFHEMGAESTFFFPPGAEPWHEVITPWQHEFHGLTGKVNAQLFDEKSLLYYTKENYDLFCPSFGDTWPLFNGSAGFTYEQGGGGYTGLALKREAGDTLTLEKRIDGHFTASMATLKVSYENRQKLIEEFNKFFDDNINRPAFRYKSVIIKNQDNLTDLTDLLQLLDRNQIRYSYAGNTGKKYRGFDYLRNREGEVTIETGDILISAYQPQSRFVQILFEPDSKASDSLSYDLTAWAVPYAYNLRAFAIEERIKPAEGRIQNDKAINTIPSEKPYAYAVVNRGFNTLKFISSLYGKDIRTRYALKPFSSGGSEYQAGSFIIARGDNMSHNSDFDRIVNEVANRTDVKLSVLTTGLAEKGKDAGSDYSVPGRSRKVAILMGDGISQGSAGELWYFFERELEYPVTVISSSDAARVDLTAYDVLLLPSGSYSGLKDTIVDFAKRGGRVVAFENAISIFSTLKSTSLSADTETRNNELKAADKKTGSGDPVHLKKFGDENRHMLSERSAASIYRVVADTTNPFMFGLGKEWFILKRSQPYPYLSKGQNAGYILDNSPVAGFAGYKYQKLIKNTMVVGSENIGGGMVIYVADNPYFRAFWKSGRILLWNVIFR